MNECRMGIYDFDVQSHYLHLFNLHVLQLIPVSRLLKSVEILHYIRPLPRSAHRLGLGIAIQ